MPEQKLSEKAVLIRQIRATLLLAVMSFVCGATAVFSLNLASAIAVVGIAMYLFFMVFYLNKWFNSYRFFIGDEQIIIEKGVFGSKQIHIYKSKVQYTQIIQTPIQKIFRTCTVAYQTAGAVVYLSEIDLNNVDGANFNGQKITKNSHGI